MRQKYKGEDVKSRLHNTIIRHNSLPFLCDVDSSGLIGLIDIPTGNLISRVHADDEGLDISSINIGFVNIIDPDYKTAVYLKREPLRRFKQGIEFEYLTQKVLRANMTSVPKGKLMSTGFVDAVLGRFPTLTQALDFITKKGWHSVALSRDIALKRESDVLKVFIRDSEVGYMKLGTLRLIVPKTDQSYYHIVYLNEIKGWDIIEGHK